MATSTTEGARSIDVIIETTATIRQFWWLARPTRQTGRISKSRQSVDTARRTAVTRCTVHLPTAPYATRCARSADPSVEFTGLASGAVVGRLVIIVARNVSGAPSAVTAVGRFACVPSPAHSASCSSPTHRHCHPAQVRTCADGGHEAPGADGGSGACTRSPRPRRGRS